LKIRRYWAREWERSSWENSFWGGAVKGHGRVRRVGDRMGSVGIRIVFGSLLSVIVVATVRRGRAIGLRSSVVVVGGNRPVVDYGYFG
jgi:hypothetical protein